MHTLKKICLIPARSGSKRIPHKNIYKINNVPLLAYSILAASPIFKPDEIVVSTDSKEYGKIAKEWGATVLKRPKELSGDGVIDYRVVRHFVERYQCDLIIYLRPTTPFRTTDRISDAICVMSHDGYDSLRSVELMSESAYKCFRVGHGVLRPLTKIDFTDLPNQKLPKTYHPNGYVDIMRSEIVLAGSLWGRGRYAYVTPRTVEIDTPEDLQYAEFIAQKERKWHFEKTID